jgi:hypothetical protein
MDGRGLVYGTIPEFAWRDYDKPQTTSVGTVASRDSIRISFEQKSEIIAWANLFGVNLYETKYMFKSCHQNAWDQSNINADDYLFENVAKF